MAKYFTQFPTVAYNLDNNVLSSQLVTNIVTRFSFEDKFKTNISAFFFYTIKDGDTPEGLAYKLYGSVNYHWIILLLNDIIDPQYDWPLQTDSFYKYIDAKYISNSGSNTTGQGVYWAQSNIHSYYQTDTQLVTGTDIININNYEIDANTYATLIEINNQELHLEDGNILRSSTMKSTKTYFDYELEVNESKRNIKILHKQFITPLEIEIRNMFK